MRFNLLDFLFGKQLGNVFPNAVITVRPVLHFGFCLFHRLALINDAVHSGNQTGTVRAMITMDKYRAVLLLFFNQV